MVMVSEGRHMLMRMVLHGGHSAVRMGEERIGGGSWRLAVVRRAVDGVSCPWRLVVNLTWMTVCGELVGNARGLLRIVHGIGGESRHSVGEKGGKREKEEEGTTMKTGREGGKSFGWSWSS